MHSFSSRSPISSMTNSRRVALPNVLKTRIFDIVSTALRSMFVASRIGDREVILQVGKYLFHTHRFCVGRMVKHLIVLQVLMWFLKNAKRNRGTAVVRTVVYTTGNHSHTVQTYRQMQ